MQQAELYNPATGIWTGAGFMTRLRYYSTATLLPTGKVLVAGGSGPAPENTAELYDPAGGTWAVTGMMGETRTSHTAVLLPTGKVLVAGGSEGDLSTADTVEIYDPELGTWATTGAMTVPRILHAMALRDDGQVLVAGGGTAGNYLAAAELYNPATGIWAATASLPSARQLLTATVLADGRVLTAGGGSGPSSGNAELFGVSLTGAEGAAIAQTGIFSDAGGIAAVTLAANSGTVTQNHAAGTWSWSPAAGFNGPAASKILITATNTAGAVTTTGFDFSATNSAPSVTIGHPRCRKKISR